MKEEEVEELMKGQEDSNGCINYEGERQWPVMESCHGSKRGGEICTRRGQWC